MVKVGDHGGNIDDVLSACETRHAALVSCAGELYTWGYGKDGNLGHGSLKSLSSPRRVLGGWVPKGEGVRGLSCSDGCTAAVTSDGSLYTWGRGLSGQLGHGDCYPCAIPKRVVFEPSLNCAPVARVVRVSVGPTHTAAITADGRLYTWGDGQFGQLGHGSTSPEYHPRQVEALEGMFVTAVACGWWHTAAIAYGCPDADGNGGHPSGGNTQVTTWAADEGEEEVHDLVHQQQHHDQPLAQQAAQPHALQQEGSDLMRSAAADHPMPSPFLSRSGRILGPSREQQGLDESQGRGSLDSQHRESPKSAERGGEENASVGASSNAEGGADGAQGGGRLWRRRADLAQINAGGLSEKESDSSRLGKLHTRRGGLSSKGSRSPSRSPREGLWGDISLPGKRTVSFQDEVDDGLSHQRRSHSFSPASSPQLAPTPTRESPLRHSSELFVWKSDVQPPVQRQGNGPERAKGAVSPNGAFHELPQPANPQQPAHRASAPPGGGYGHEPHIGAGGRRSGDSAGSFEGHGDTQHVGGSGRRGGWGAGETRQLQQRLHRHHQNQQQQQQQQQQRPPQVMADALQEGLFSESASLLLSANNDVEHACRSSAPTRTSAPNALIGKNNRPVTVAGEGCLRMQAWPWCCWG
ncbi:hypothetical protein DUNSADRAFT_3183 [Dunaliella salina]|uniref:Uncharacterized protein n=1 Tax=Dunaliella salina TaxID=3046 RepID=A0ABQ7GUH3_DUNSA|nr:hypothetical protein DUNSADRAFT_3183 [Dunaliella salina]|eukprot:KAF5838268.1 hypothetical protein DUNSADRAFT_3183 [Dunaliella salina]